MLTLVFRLVILRKIYFQSKVLKYSFFCSFEMFLFPEFCLIFLFSELGWWVFILKKVALHRQVCCREDTSKMSEMKTLWTFNHFAIGHFTICFLNVSGPMFWC